MLWHAFENLKEIGVLRKYDPVRLIWEEINVKVFSVLKKIKVSIIKEFIQSKTKWKQKKGTKFFKIKFTKLLKNLWFPYYIDF